MAFLCTSLRLTAFTKAGDARRALRRPQRLSQGALFPQAYQSHAATETCPGHSTILTGSHPARTGIVAAAVIQDGRYRIAETWLISAATALTTRTFGRVVANLGWYDIRLPCPVHAGDTVSSESTIVEKRESKSRKGAGIVELHHRAVAAVDRVVPVRQVLSIDEMECELTGRWRAREQALALARAAKAEVLRSVGECMRTSVGIAPNTLLAKLASNMHKPDGLTVIEQHEIPERLYGLPVSAINGIGPRMVRRLARCGITSSAMRKSNGVEML